MSLFRGSGRLEQKLAQNNDPMKQKKLWVKSFYCAAVLAALGLFFLLPWAASLPSLPVSCWAARPSFLSMAW